MNEVTQEFIHNGQWVVVYLEFLPEFRFGCGIHHAPEWRLVYAPSRDRHHHQDHFVVRFGGNEMAAKAAFSKVAEQVGIQP